MGELNALLSWATAHPETAVIAGTAASIIAAVLIFRLDICGMRSGAKVALLGIALTAWFYIYAVSPETGIQRVLYRFAGWAGPGLTFGLVANEARERGYLQLSI